METCVQLITNELQQRADALAAEFMAQSTTQPQQDDGLQNALSKKKKKKSKGKSQQVSTADNKAALNNPPKGHDDDNTDKSSSTIQLTQLKDGTRAVVVVAGNENTNGSVVNDAEQQEATATTALPNPTTCLPTLDDLFRHQTSADTILCSVVVVPFPPTFLSCAGAQS